jgi:hypothetical protein
VRRECVHPRNLRCRHSPNDPPVPRNSPKNHLLCVGESLAISAARSIKHA